MAALAEISDPQLLRYSRHIMLNGLGIEAQQRLLAAHALIVGAGGLGSPTALFLAASGVGHITVVDDDDVDLTNLQRQIMHTSARVGQSKAASAREAMLGLNPEIEVSIIAQRAQQANLPSMLSGVDILLDCCDNFATRQAINSACIASGTPWVSGSALGWDGQITFMDPRQKSSPCYACIFPPDHQPPEVACATMGVFAPLVGIIGAIQASEALKHLCGLGSALTCRLLMINASMMKVSEISVLRNPLCPVCSEHHRG